MKKTIGRLARTALFAGLFFGICVGVHFIAKDYIFSQRLEGNLLQLPDVKDVSIDEDNQLTITMDDGANLKDVYGAAEKIIGDGNYQIKIRDNPSPDLIRLADQSDTAIQEAAARGNFTAMEAVIQKKAVGHGVSANVFVDEKRIYLELKKSGKSVYRVVQRQEPLPIQPSS